MPTAKVTKNVSAAIGGGNVLCSTLIFNQDKGLALLFFADKDSTKNRCFQTVIFRKTI